MSPMASNFVHAIEAYVEGKADIETLQAALIDATWDNPDAPQLALEAEHLIAETTSGDRSAEALRDALAAALKSSYVHA